MLSKLAILFGTRPDGEDLKAEIQALLGRETSHRVTQIINAPQGATAKEAYAFSKVLDIPLPQLVHEYDLAQEELSTIIENPEKKTARMRA